jgi:hypothetical protein
MTVENFPDDAALIAAARRARRELPDAPEWLVLRAEAIADARPQAAPAASLRQRLQALLSVDSWAGAPALALRSGADAAARQLLFTAGGTDVDLRLAPAGTLWRLRGQVLGPDESGEVEIDGPPLPAPLRQALDAMGSFELGDLPAGEYRLTLRLASGDIELPPLTLAAPAADG